jgi:hypothetical protein
MSDYASAFNEAYRRMVARRNGEEKCFLHLTFLHGTTILFELILEERYACQRMETESGTAPTSSLTVESKPQRLHDGFRRLGCYPRFHVTLSAIWFLRSQEHLPAIWERPRTTGDCPLEA